MDRDTRLSIGGLHYITGYSCALFTAFPVHDGDAFLWETSNNFCMLVDGGGNQHQVADMLRGHSLSRVRLDVVVCTHNDSDHAKGLIGLLDCEDVEIRELWLPVEFRDSLVESKRIGVEETLALLRREIRVPVDEGEDPPRPHESTSTRKEEIATPLEEDLAEHAERLAAALPKRIASPPPKAGTSRKPGRKKRAKLTLGAELEAMRNIVELARRAHERGIPIVWLRVERPFDATRGYFTRYGVEVLNARAAAHTSPTSRPLEELLFLTTQNIRALVLRVTSGEEGERRVLFCSDSDLSFCSEPIKADVFTAPHHGATANDSAYERLPEEALAVRSDMVMAADKFRPSSRYLKHSHRMCTRCRGSSGSQTVRVWLGSFGVEPIGDPCSCVERATSTSSQTTDASESAE